MIIMRITALIVTYKRFGELFKCIGAINAQMDAKVAEIGIWDNDPESFFMSAFRNAEFTVENRPHADEGTRLYRITKQDSVSINYYVHSNNIGMAGALNRLMNIYSGQSNDFLWVMDDDGIPDSMCLFNLLKWSSKYQYLSPLVMDITGKDILSFALNKTKKPSDIINCAQNGIYLGHANPWNGLLLSTELVRKIGLPIKEYFIWGEEVEYQLRAAQITEIATCVDAIFYHPQERIVYKDKFCGVGFIEPEDLKRRAVFFCNQTHIFKKYNKTALVFFLLRYSFYYVLMKKLDIRNYVFFVKCYMSALLENRRIELVDNIQARLPSA